MMCELDLDLDIDIDIDTLSELLFFFVILIFCILTITTKGWDPYWHWIARIPKY
jgi:hypothetical protein